VIGALGRTIGFAALGLAAALVRVPPAGSQAEGSISGQVLFVGQRPVPAPPIAVKPADAAACGAHASDETFAASADGALANVIVYLEAPPPGSAAPPAATVKLSNHGCRFQPHVQAATVGSTLIVGNDDNILHNTHAYFEGGATFFNLGLPFKGVQVPRPLARTGMIQFKCDAGHTWMSGWLLVLDHRFHAVTDASGSFRIPGLPAGGYRLRAWHERLGSRTLDARVEPGTEARVRIEYQAGS
jgi:hypothetical protein